MPQKRNRNSEFSMGLKEKLLELRKSQKMTQIEFANFVGVSSSSIGLYETGERIPDAEILFRIATKCGVSADYLLGISSVPTVKEDIKMMCDYTGLSEAAINRFHWDKRFNSRNNELISLLIAPDNDSKSINDLLYITGALRRYGDKYFKLINKMSSLYDTIKDLPKEEFEKEISTVFQEEKSNNYDYIDVFVMLKDLIDDYINAHIKTSANADVKRKYDEAVNNRREELQ